MRWNCGSIICLLSLAFAIASPAQELNHRAAVDEPARPDPLLGLWRVHYGRSSFTLELRPDGSCLMIYGEQGSTQITHSRWSTLPGGVLVDSLPRFRLWPGRHSQELRGEMETLHPDMTSRAIREFPKQFFMRKLESQLRLPPAFANRPIPENWRIAELPAEWDQTAGQPTQLR